MAAALLLRTNRCFVRRMSEMSSWTMMTTTTTTATYYSRATVQFRLLLVRLASTKRRDNDHSTDAASTNPNPSPMDEFVSRLMLDGRRTPADRTKFQRTVRRSPATAADDAKSYSRKPLPQPTGGDNSFARTTTTTTSKKYDRQCDRIVGEFLERGASVDALAAFEKFARHGGFPADKTLVRLACVCAAEGDVHAVRMISDLSSSSSSSDGGSGGGGGERSRSMAYRHYVAEATWRNGDHALALRMFAELFERHPKQRRKVINMCSFCLRDIVDGEETLAEPAAVRSAALDFVDFCARRASDPTSWVPAANLWRAAFTSESYDVHCRFVERLYDRFADAPDRLRASVVAAKIPAIVRQARDESRPDVLQRLMQTVLALAMTDRYAEVMGGYVDYLCDVEDRRGAREALRFMNRMSIYVESSTAHRLFSLLLSGHGHGHGHGKVKLPIVPSAPVVPTIEYKF